jgi:hypothetical protein
MVKFRFYDSGFYIFIIITVSPFATAAAIIVTSITIIILCDHPERRDT